MKKIIISVLITVAVIFILIIGFAIYKFNFTNNNFHYACTEEAKLCPDGSAVGRTGPNCEFAACPEQSTADAIKQLFAGKYLKYDNNMEVKIYKETTNHAGGMIRMFPGEPGGLFLTVKIGGQWQIAYEGNGSVDCNKMRTQYNFPDEVLKPNFCD